MKSTEGGSPKFGGHLKLSTKIYIFTVSPTPLLQKRNKVNLHFSKCISEEKREQANAYQIGIYI